jgi:cysteine desulfurase
MTIYLDYNASAPLHPDAKNALIAALEQAGNASSIHKLGRAARGQLESARESLARLLGCLPRQIIFTSGGTESNALALRAVGNRAVLTSSIEHDSLLNPTQNAQRLPVLSDGTLDLAALEAALAQHSQPVFVSIMAANNETGVVQPMAQIAERVRAHGSLLHCDGAQAFGKIPLPLPCFGAHLLSLSAHKIGGMAGVGALVIADEVSLSPLLQGGGQELGRRAGSENVAGICAFAAAACALDAASWRLRARELRDHLETRIEALCPGAALGYRFAERLPTTATLYMPNTPAELQVIALDLAGFAISAGSACSSGKVKMSHVLSAMGLPSNVVRCCVRVSLGWDTTLAQIEAFCSAWASLYRQRVAAAAA